MGLSAIDYFSGNSIIDSSSACALSDAGPSEPGADWIENIMDSMQENGIKKKLFHAAKVHPCIIDGHRVLVYEKGLKEQEPQAYQELLEFAGTNNFELKEDQRNRNKNANVIFERRMSKTAPMVLLAGGLLCQGVANADSNMHSSDSTKVMPDVEVLGEKASSERAYLVRDGKRFISGPYGELESILAVAAETKQNGELKRVSTRNIEMPQDYIGGFINRYDYQFPQNCGGGKYSYYEGEGFGALGYHKDGKVIMDVLVSGAFGAPKLWGPYDQVLYDNHEMQLMMGDGSKDGMGLLKASYSIGMTAVMADEDFKDYGDSYTDGVQTAVNCTTKDGKQKPIIRQANAGGAVVSLR